MNKLPRYSNFAIGTVIGSFNAGSTTISLSSNHGDRFPDPPFRITLWNSTDFANPANARWLGEAELIQVSGKTSNSFYNLTRGMDGTDAISKVAGKTYSIICGVTAWDLANLIPTINMVAFGADPTGATDSGPAIQAAFNAADTGDVIFFPIGLYLISSSLLLSNKNIVTIMGEGAEIVATIRGTETIPNDGYVFFKLNTCNQVRINGMEVHGGGLAHNVIGLKDCTNCVIEDCYILGTTGNYTTDYASGIVSVNGNGNRFQRNRITSVFNGINTIYESAGAEQNCIIIDNTIWQTKIDGITAKGKRIIIANNSIRDLNTASGLGVGISLGSNPGYPSEEITVSKNIINNCLQCGIEVTNIAAHQAGKKIIISDNIISETIEQGILGCNLLKSRIAGNILRDTGGIALCSFGDGSAGDDQSHDVKIDDNILDDTRTGTARASYGIVLNLSDNATSNCMKNISIERNRVRNFKYAGISTVRTSTGTASSIKIGNNRVTDCSDNGLVITTGFTQIIVESNVFLNNSTYDIRYNCASAGDIQLINNRYGTIYKVDQEAYEDGSIIEVNQTYHISMGRKWTFGSAAPGSGTWAVKDICLNISPASGQPMGWVCTVAWTPGTWNAWGTIA